MKARSLTPPKDRETLRTCEACRGSGFITTAETRGYYHKVFCKWCDGQGLSDLRMWGMYQRWLGIYRHNTLAGACEAKRPPRP